MGWKRRRFGRDVPELPAAPELKGPVVGARLLGAAYQEEGTLADGAPSERWRLTDDLEALLLGDAEFAAGGTIDEVTGVLEARYPSPIPAATRIEVCDDRDLKVHAMPFGDPVLMTREKNPDYRKGYRWHDEYINRWVPDPIARLEDICAVGGDLLIGADTEHRLREDPDFEWSDLVISKRDAWYSVVKHRPGKAGARRKGRSTVERKVKQARELSEYAGKMRVAAAEAYMGLRDELVDLGVDLALAQVKGVYRGYYRESEADYDGKRPARMLRALLPIHAALKGKHAYRHNDAFQKFLAAYRDRPEGLDPLDWGNYADVQTWVETEARLKRPRPTKAMIAAREEALRQERWSRTCAGCGTVEAHANDLSNPPRGREGRYASGARLCGDCWQAELDAADRDAHAATLAESGRREVQACTRSASPGEEP